jgi:tRNA (cytidine/uridine-2'-O-)-methyltransferase
MQVVLVYPQIPQNTGNIARTCAGTATPLHLVAPLGFEISDRYLKRAGLDYWPYVDLHYHNSYADFQKVCADTGGRLLGFTVRGEKNYLDFSYEKTDWLVFGSESQGLPPDILAQCSQTIYIPISQPQVRSFNLSVSVAVGLFEARRQVGS